MSLIMANGQYGDPTWYKLRAHNYERIICADGGANWATKFGIIPNAIVGDMDSINETERSIMAQNGVLFYTFPSEKDFTDTYLAIDIAVKKGAKSISVWGGTGSRLDHTLANILSAVYFVKNGVSIRFESPNLTIYVIKDSLLLHGAIGDTVTILALEERAAGVSLQGFKYPLDNVILEADQPIGVSNIINSNESLIQIKSGILAVFHNHGTVD
jgi:thiamine pyrophosphokinase